MKNFTYMYRNSEWLRGRLQRTSGKWGGGGFEISDIPGRGEGGGLWKFGRPKISEKIELLKFLRAL